MSRQDGVVGNSQKQESAASLRAHVQCVVSTGGVGREGRWTTWDEVSLYEGPAVDKNTDTNTTSLQCYHSGINVRTQTRSKFTTTYQNNNDHVQESSAAFTCNTFITSTLHRAYSTCSPELAPPAPPPPPRHTVSRFGHHLSEWDQQFAVCLQDDIVVCMLQGQSPRSGSNVPGLSACLCITSTWHFCIRGSV